MENIGNTNGASPKKLDEISKGLQSLVHQYSRIPQIKYQYLANLFDQSHKLINPF